MYSCHLHPSIRQELPGDCPLCGMPLEQGHIRSKKLSWLLFRFWVSAVLTLLLIVFTLYPLFSLLWLQALFTTPIVFWGGWPFYARAARALFKKSLNLFTLISLGVLTIYFYSLIALFSSHVPIAYFETACVIITLALLSEWFESKARRLAGRAIEALIHLAPKSATRIQNKKEQLVLLEEVKRADILRVYPGERIPVDGVILEGESRVDESMMAAEKIFKEKKPGDKVFGGTLNGKGSFIMLATHVGKESLLAQIVEIVERATKSKTVVERLVDRITALFVPFVLIAALLTFAIWFWIGEDPKLVHAMLSSISVLIIGSTSALRLATPISITASINKGAVNGILVKEAQALERMALINTLVIDKTGTLTEGKMQIATIVCVETFSEEDLLLYAASLSVSSQHPFSTPIVDQAIKRKLSLLPVDAFAYFSGMGCLGEVGQRSVAIGSQALMRSLGIEFKNLEAVAESMRLEGHTVLFVALDSSPAGLLAISDQIRESSFEAMQHLHAEQIQIVMLTADHITSALLLAKKFDIDEVEAEVLPEDKQMIIKEMQMQGRRVAMAGDGINDAPALMQADVGIAMGSSSDVTLENTGLALLQGDLSGISKARILSTATLRIIRQNLFFAFFYNLLAIPIAAGIFYPFLKLLLNPMIASIAMTASSLCVILNSLRLKKIKL